MNFFRDNRNMVLLVLVSVILIVSMVISSSGKPTPQSMTIISLPYSRTVMFLPISSRPPRGIIFSFSANLKFTPFKKRRKGITNKQPTPEIRP